MDPQAATPAYGSTPGLQARSRQSPQVDKPDKIDPRSKIGEPVRRRLSVRTQRRVATIPLPSEVNLRKWINRTRQIKLTREARLASEQCPSPTRTRRVGGAYSTGFCSVLFCRSTGGARRSTRRSFRPYASVAGALSQALPERASLQ